MTSPTIYLIDGRSIEHLRHCYWWTLECRVHSNPAGEHSDSTQLDRGTLAGFGSLEFRTSRGSEPMFPPAASEAAHYNTCNTCHMHIMWWSQANNVVVTFMSCDGHTHIMWWSHAHHVMVTCMQLVMNSQCINNTCTAAQSTSPHYTHLQSNLLCVYVTGQYGTAAIVTLAWDKPGSEALPNDKPWRTWSWQQRHLSEVSWTRLLTQRAVTHSTGHKLHQRKWWQTTPTITFTNVKIARWYINMKIMGEWTWWSRLCMHDSCTDLVSLAYYPVITAICH